KTSGSAVSFPRGVGDCNVSFQGVSPTQPGRSGMAIWADAQFHLKEPTITVAMERDMPQQKTYWHLLEQRRMPTEYEIVTSKLLCYTGEGFTGKRFELDVPLKDWYRRYQEESPLVCNSWEKFRD